MSQDDDDFTLAVLASRAERRRESSRAYARRNALKRRAYRFVQDALFFGYLTRPKRCERCTRRCKPEAHHTDYMQPLSVDWLCKRCHESEHHDEPSH